MTEEQSLENRLADALRKTLKREVDRLNNEQKTDRKAA